MATRRSPLRPLVKSRRPTRRSSSGKPRDPNAWLRGVEKTLKAEDKVQRQWVLYMEENYPEALFFCNILSGVKLPGVVAGRAKLLGSPLRMPDCIVLEPRGPYAGLLIELKRETDKEGRKLSLLTRKGQVKAQYKEQHYMLLQLSERGYSANFAFGFEQAKELTDAYFSLPPRLDTNR